MTAAYIWNKPHQNLSSSYTTCIMSLYDRLKVRKLLNLSMRDYLIEIQLTCDSLASCGHPIEDMQQISIILNGVKWQYDSVVSVIHASKNPHDIASITSIILDVESKQRDMLFDTSLSATNAVVKTSAEKLVSVSIDSGQSSVLDPR